MRPRLFGEEHGEGHARSINVETIGNNKRYPIYLVCLEAGAKRGFKNFKMPGKKARLFAAGNKVVVDNLS